MSSSRHRSHSHSHHKHSSSSHRSRSPAVPSALYQSSTSALNSALANLNLQQQQQPINGINNTSSILGRSYTNLLQQQPQQQQQSQQPLYTTTVASAAPIVINAIAHYTVTDLYSALVSAGVPRDEARILRSEEIDGTAAATLTDEHLERFGIGPTYGHRAKLLKLLTEMCRDPMGYYRQQQQQQQQQLQQFNQQQYQQLAYQQQFNLQQQQRLYQPLQQSYQPQVLYNNIPYATPANITNPAAAAAIPIATAAINQPILSPTHHTAAAAAAAGTPIASTVPVFNYNLSVPTVNTGTTAGGIGPLITNNMLQPPFSPSIDRSAQAAIWQSYSPSARIEPINTVNHSNYSHYNQKYRNKSRNRSNSTSSSSSSSSNSSIDSDGYRRRSNSNKYRSNSTGRISNSRKSHHSSTVGPLTPSRLAGLAANNTINSNRPGSAHSKHRSHSHRRSNSDSSTSDLESDAAWRAKELSIRQAESTAAAEAELATLGYINANRGSTSISRRGHRGRNRTALKSTINTIYNNTAESAIGNTDPTAPIENLRLDWVYGYRSFDSRSNLVYNANGDIIYPAAGVVIIYNPHSRLQKHFLGHNADIRCLAQNPINLNLIATGQSAPINQSASISNNSKHYNEKTAPYVCIFDSTNLNTVIQLPYTNADRSIRCLSFSSDGNYLASVSNDNHHCIKIWDWRQKQLLVSAHCDTTPIFAIKWNHHAEIVSNNNNHGNHHHRRKSHHNNANDSLPLEQSFITVGKRHCAIWRFDSRNRLSGSRVSFNGIIPSNVGRKINFYSVAFSERGYACCGAEDGSIYIFNSSTGELVKLYQSIHRGKILTMDWYPGGLITGGSDGLVQCFDSKIQLIHSIQFTHKITSVYMHSNSNCIVGTQGSQIYEIPAILSQSSINTIKSDQQLQPIVHGHFDGELNGLAIVSNSNPSSTAATPTSRYFLTSGEDNQLCVWDYYSHSLVNRTWINHPQQKNKLNNNPNESAAAAVALKSKSSIGTSIHPISMCSNAIGYNPHTSHIAVGTADCQLHLYTLQNLNKLFQLNLAPFIEKSRIDIDSNNNNNNNSNNNRNNNKLNHNITVISYSPGGLTLAIGTNSGSIALLDCIDSYRCKYIINSHFACITSCDWSLDGTILSCSDSNYQLQYYSIQPTQLELTHKNENYIALRTVEWATITNPLNYMVNAVFDPTIDLIETNTTAVQFNSAANSNPLLVTGDDSGSIKLYRYPALNRQLTKYKLYRGHSTSVSKVRFTPDNRYILSTGGPDLTIMQWAIIK